MAIEKYSSEWDQLLIKFSTVQGVSIAKTAQVFEVSEEYFQYAVQNKSRNHLATGMWTEVKARKKSDWALEVVSWFLLLSPFLLYLFN